MAIDDSTSTTSIETPPDGTDTISIETLLDEEHSFAFCGLVPQDEGQYPDEISTTGDRFTDDPLSLKAVIQHLPTASSGDLYADNRFVAEDDTVDTAAIRAVDGLDIDAIETLTGAPLIHLARHSSATTLTPVMDHQDIIDERRQALRALGAPVKFRWQIASDRYCIVPPTDAYLPAVGALQQRGATDAFGWAHYRDWGGELKLSVILPALKRTLTPVDDPDNSESSTGTDETSDGVALTSTDPSADDGVTVFGGFQTGYDFRGSQAVWARPLEYFPASDVVFHGVGRRYSRRHVGKATNAAHERANDRVPISEWWDQIYTDLDRHTTTIDRALLRSRTIAIDFTVVPYSIAEFYTYLGIPATYAEEAADRASTFAQPATEPTLWNLQISLVIALDALYQGSRASDTYLDYNEVAQQLLRQPAHSIQLAAQEYELQTEEETEPHLPPEQQTLSDTIADLVAIPGVSADTEADLDAVDAHRIQESVDTRIQQRLDMIGS